MNTQEKAQYDDILEQNHSLQRELTPFRESYFKGLSTATIAELAKSQIKAVARSIEAEEVIDYIYKTTTNAGTENAIRIIRQTIEQYKGR